jgi:hypothetical protein
MIVGSRLAFVVIMHNSSGRFGNVGYFFLLFQSKSQGYYFSLPFIKTTNSHNRNHSLMEVVLV